jgi:hypothetical protein
MFKTFLNEVAEMQTFSDVVMDVSEGMVSTQKG